MKEMRRTWRDFVISLNWTRILICLSYDKHIWVMHLLCWGNWACLLSYLDFLVCLKVVNNETNLSNWCLVFNMVKTIMWLVFVFFLVNYELEALFILEVWKLWWIWCWYSWNNCIQMLVILWVNACMQNEGDVDGEFCCWTCA